MIGPPNDELTGEQPSNGILIFAPEPSSIDIKKPRKSITKSASRKEVASTSAFELRSVGSDAVKDALSLIPWRGATLQPVNKLKSNFKKFVGEVNDMLTDALNANIGGFKLDTVEVAVQMSGDGTFGIPGVVGGKISNQASLKLTFKRPDSSSP